MRRLTSKQEQFIDNVVAGMTYVDAYKQAGYKVDSMSAESIAKESSRIANSPRISPTIAQRKKQLADKAIWSREEAIRMLKEIADEARANVIASGKDGEYYSAANANTAIKAIEQANKMCGYNEAEKREIDAVISVELLEAGEFAE